MLEPTKLCPKCMELKPVTHFDSVIYTNDHLTEYCGWCMSVDVSKIKNRPFNKICYNIHNRCLSKGLECNLTPQYLRSIFTGICPVYGNEIYLGEAKGRRATAQLDRLVPELGYMEGNVQFISAKANRRKQDSSIEDLEKLIAYMKSETQKNP